MQQYDGQEPAVWRKFARKNLLLSTLVNLLFNTCYPYFNFQDLRAVCLFHGSYCFARFILPMAFLLPFMITFDMMKKSMAVAEQCGNDMMFPGRSSKYKFIFRIAGINGMGTLVFILLVMLCVDISLPENYRFDGRLLSVLMGSLAAILAMYFTLYSIKKVRELLWSL
ncbi:hypothetical protein [Pedobacter hartonius]|uniref:Uncharacterized protein n=1 Tax=Pedobacter hartonius TaxID=425514 RepID=A0A1H4GKA0_9SPHI|nr:hypothetical protein [Pedobacter hartonius]SEB10063.1 hypothetical protein SAMN05443550_110143 [Pedobacter hartonius]